MESGRREVPANLLTRVGSLRRGTCTYETRGDHDAYREWVNALFSHFMAGLLNPSCAGMYAGVSRTALHKALREGRLIAFSFRLTQPQEGPREVGPPYVLIPIDELNSWRRVLAERAKQHIKITLSIPVMDFEINGESPNERAGDGANPRGTSSRPLGQVPLTDRINVSRLPPGVNLQDVIAAINRTVQHEDPSSHVDGAKPQRRKKEKK